MIMFKEVAGFSNYLVSPCGEVRNCLTNHVFKPSKSKAGYLTVGIRNDKGKRVFKLVHRLVYETYVGAVPEGLVVDHIDNDPTNCQLSNLQAITQRDNINRKFANLPCPILKHTNGGRVRVTLPYKDFCHKLGLQDTNFGQLLKGKRKSHKGWSLL